MWRIFPAFCLVLAGCSSSPRAPSAADAPTDVHQETRVLGQRFSEGTITRIQPEVDRVSHQIPAPPDAVFEALVQTYRDIGIEIAGADPAARIINNPGLSISRRLGGERLSKYLRCGSGITGAFADRFRVQMNIFSQVKAAADGQSTVETTMQAFGINPEGTSNSRVPCGSTHQLEYRIASAIAELVAG